jgi:hypothetical protein
MAGRSNIRAEMGDGFQIVDGVAADAFLAGHGVLPGSFRRDGMEIRKTAFGFKRPSKISASGYPVLPGFFGALVASASTTPNSITCRNVTGDGRLSRELGSDQSTSSLPHRMPAPRRSIRSDT